MQRYYKMNNKIRENEWGLVEAKASVDTKEAISVVIKLLLMELRQISHYEEKDGVLRLYPYGSDKDKEKIPFLCPINCPDTLADTVVNWLESQKYGRKPDTDGSVRPGCVIEGSREVTRYISVIPKWIVYGK